MAKSSNKEMNVLLVDDEKGFLDLAKRYFRENEAKINLDVTTSAEEGLEMLEEGNYEAVVSDYKMPSMNGLDFLEAVRSSGNDVPFIILTGKGEEKVAMRALNEGADRYHQKGEDFQTQFKKLTRSIVEEVVRGKSESELKTFRKWIKNVLGPE